MDFNALPRELLEHILSNLKFSDLLSKSLVCKLWKQATAFFIGQRGRLNLNREMLDYLHVLENSNRQYQAISFKGKYKKKAMRKLLLICADKFTPRKIELPEILHDNLNRFYVYVQERRWFDFVEDLSVTMDDNKSSYLHLKNSHHRLIMPNLKHLRWTEFLHDAVRCKKAVTIVAPELETVTLFDSFIGASELTIMACDNIKRIVYSLHSQRFHDVFCGRLSQLEILCLYGDNGSFEFSFIERMPKLRWFEVCMRSKPEYLLPNLSVLYKCKTLESLMISFSNIYDLPHGTLDLTVLCHNLVNLKQIELNKVIIRNSGPVRAERLVFLRISDAKFADENDSLMLIAPKLETLSLPMNVLAKTRIDNKSSVTKLYIDMQKTRCLKDAFDLHLQPFIRSNETVRELMLWDGGYKDKIYDEQEPETTLIHVERMEIRRLHIGLNFFRSIARCQSLKHLSLVLCTIYCKDDDPNIQLAALDSMNVQLVRVQRSFRYRFPLIAGSEEQLRGQSGIFSTHDYEFGIPPSLRIQWGKQFVSFRAFDR
ncbi:uncharacterized protein LOC128743728 [Sabethes cyaneus]|uniref:uncharacterized protein LOC128743728 n=1 Tax=Sabethes cyaneus TaxID=53552 RepID=UPI00237DE21E|nr:uncharacterized protein LOC128743728 [Sabethes cyaneus]